MLNGIADEGVGDQLRLLDGLHGHVGVGVVPPLLQQLGLLLRRGIGRRRQDDLWLGATMGVGPGLDQLLGLGRVVLGSRVGEVPLLPRRERPVGHRELPGADHVLESLRIRGGREPAPHVLIRQRRAVLADVHHLVLRLPVLVLGQVVVMLVVLEVLDVLPVLGHQDVDLAGLQRVGRGQLIRDDPEIDLVQVGEILGLAPAVPGSSSRRSSGRARSP